MHINQVWNTLGSKSNQKFRKQLLPALHKGVALEIGTKNLTEKLKGRPGKNYMWSQDTQGFETWRENEE